MRNVWVLFMCVTCFWSSLAFAGKHSFQTGKLTNVATDERLIDGTSYRRVIFTVQIGEIVYTLEGGRVRRRTKDYAHGMIVGDPIQASVEGEHVFLMTPEGKDMKTDILQRERVQTK